MALASRSALSECVPEGKIKRGIEELSLPDKDTLKKLLDIGKAGSLDDSDQGNEQ